ncbi:MAG: methyltransferase domain-containing protein [Chloroflexi bacterium]|nr:methyltransferase domain-containing protein [Chloroflexota bacterium]
MSSYDILDQSYSRVAEEYATRIFAELQHKPLDRQLLNRLAERTRGRGLVCDLGCGPGQVARYLSEQGVTVMGLDAAAGMIAQAQQLNPGIPFVQGDMLALDVPDSAWAGIAAFYSLIHIHRQQLHHVLTELNRVLQPGGLLLVSFHIGSETLHLTEWWEQLVDLDFHFFQPAEMAHFLEQAGFVLEETIEREPYPEVEHPSRRCYILARKS